MLSIQNKQNTNFGSKLALLPKNSYKKTSFSEEALRSIFEGTVPESKMDTFVSGVRQLKAVAEKDGEHTYTVHLQPNPDGRSNSLAVLGSRNLQSVLGGGSFSMDLRNIGEDFGKKLSAAFVELRESTNPRNKGR